VSGHPREHACGGQESARTQTTTNQMIWTSAIDRHSIFQRHVIRYDLSKASAGLLILRAWSLR
jgi:hypothetical protein